MKYLNQTFSLATSSKVSQEEWDRIFKSDPVEMHPHQFVEDIHEMHIRLGINERVIDEVG
jgi:hypothetical protein